jgi:ABC-2 type transport system ATP-binding protein
MYVRLAFAVAVHVDPDVLLVDEVLAVGDEPFQRKCMNRIKQFQYEGRTIVLVTHALDQVAEICDRAVVLEHGRVVVDGTAREAIRTLRADFDEQAAAERKEEEPTTAARVVSVEPLDSQGRPVRQLSVGDDLVLRVTVDAREPLRDWVLGVGIDLPTGQQVMGTNTAMLGVDLEPLRGTRTIDVRLAGLHLGEGDYHVHGAMALRDQPAFHRLGEAASISVQGTGRTIGPVGVGPITLDQESAGSVRT